MDPNREQNLLLSILMPVYNEARTLRTIVDRVLAAPLPAGVDFELVCVDDGSADDSWEILEALAADNNQIRVFQHEQNRGKGAAIRTAISQAEGDIAIVQDSDLEYDPRDISKVIGPIVDGRADAVYGSRFASSPERRVLLFWHSVGNKLLTALSNMVNDLNLTDMETCYKAVRLDVLKRLRLTSERFGIEPEITTRLGQYGARIYEVPISYDGRSYAEGKNIGWRDGVEAIYLIFKFRFVDTKHVVDEELATRQSVGSAVGLRRWMLKRVSPWVGDEVLEVNAGPGHTTAELVDGKRLVVADPDPTNVESLRRRFAHLENVDVIVGDVEQPGLGEALVGDFDTVLCLDGLARTDDPKGLLQGLAKFTKPGGFVVVQAPADPLLFGPVDVSAGHHQRFLQSDLNELMGSAGLSEVKVMPFNALGYYGWRLHDSMGLKRISRLEATVFGLMLPLAKALDLIQPKVGLSLLAVGRSS